MRELLRWYAAVFDRAPIGYAAVSPDGWVKEINQVGASLFGLPKRTILRKTFAQLLVENERSKFERFLDRLIEQGWREVCEVGALLKTSEEAYLSIAGRLSKDRDQVLLTFTDITAGRRRQAQLADAQRALREDNRRKDEVVALLSSALEDPLALIQGCADLLRPAAAQGNESSLVAQRLLDEQVTTLAAILNECLDDYPQTESFTSTECWAQPAAAVCKFKVLLVEDNQDGAGSLQAALELQGHEVVVAHSGVLGIERATAARPDVVICNIGLPDMDGCSIARALRNSRHTTPPFLIAMSGFARRKDIDRALNAGFDRYLAKPASFGALRQIFAEIQRRRFATAVCDDEPVNEALQSANEELQKPPTKS